MTLKLFEDLNRRSLERGFAKSPRQMAGIVFLSTVLGYLRRYSDRAQPTRFRISSSGVHSQSCGG
jgi:hypothetical protein